MYEWIGCLLFATLAYVGGLVTQWGLQRRLTRLEFEQADFAAELLSEKRKRAIGTRGSVTKSEQEVLNWAQGQHPRDAEKYANDWELPGGLSR